jgi:hypothetical protein
MLLEFEIPVHEFGRTAITTLEIEAEVVPRVGEYVAVEGRRKVLKVTHFYGVAVSNGREDAHAAFGNRTIHGPTVIYVRLDEPKD